MTPLRIVALATALLVPSLAYAEPAGLRGACKTDLQTLCAGIQPGGGRIRECMKQHRTELSTGCKVALADRMLEREGHRGAMAQGGEQHIQQSVLNGGSGGSASIKTVPAGN